MRDNQLYLPSTLEDCCKPGQANIEFDSVDLVTPTGLDLAKAVKLSVSPGQSLMVTGPNACGKTSLFRLLGGLWPVTGGSISAPCDESGTPGIADVFLVPQRIYMVLGSLADQVTYPKVVPRGAELDGVLPVLQSLLELVGMLGARLPMCGCMHCVCTREAFGWQVWATFPGASGDGTLWYAGRMC